MDQKRFLMLASLQVRTYAVVPIRESLGLVAFVGGTQPLKAVITHPSLVPKEVRAQCLDVRLCVTDTASHAPSISVAAFHSGAHASTFSHTSSYHQWFWKYL